MDKQLGKLCKYHMECKHVKINAEKVPYLCEKLNIITLPSVVLVRNRKVRLFPLREIASHLRIFGAVNNSSKRGVCVVAVQTEHTCIGFDEFGGHEAPTAHFAAVFNKHAVYEDQKESYA